MSTHAAIYYYDPETELYDGVTVNWDGYIKDGGVGETLFIHWNSPEKVKALCTDERSEIRTLDTNITDTEWYDDESPYRAAKWKNLTWDKILYSNIGQVDYNYIFKDNKWFVYNPKRNELKPLADYFQD